MQVSSKQKNRSKFWFLPRFSLRAFLVLAVLLAVSIAPLAQRTRQQMRVCEELDSENVALFLVYHLSDPPAWLQFLPKDWLAIAGGHWCCRVERVNLEYSGGYNVPDALKLFKSHLQLVAKLPSLDQLIVRFDDQELTSEAIAHYTSELRDALTLLTQVNGLQALRFEVDDAASVLEALPQLTHLRTLDLGDDSSEKPIDLRNLTKLRGLQVFGFPNEFATNNDLSPLAQLPALREVRAGYLNTIASDMQCFLGHPTLEVCELSRSSYDDEVFKVLGSCPKLKSIHGYIYITDEGLSHLRGLKQLEEIFLSDAAISDVGFAYLGECNALKRIKCDRTKLTDAIGPTLARLANLHSLDLDKTLTTKNLLQYLKGNKNLIEAPNISLGNQTIELSELLAFFNYVPTKVPAFPSIWSNWDCALAHFGGKPAGIETRTVVDLEGITGIRGRLNQLQSPNEISTLVLGCTDVDDNDLNGLNSLTKLSSLDIHDTAVTIDGLALLAGLSRLTSLAAGPFDNMDEATLAISKLTSLEKLQVYGDVPEIDAAVAMLSSMKKLKGLSLSDCTIDEKLAAELCQLPVLEYLSARNFEWDKVQVERRRLQAARKVHGIPEGLRTRLLANPSQRNFTIVDESELTLLKGRKVLALDATGVQLSRESIFLIGTFKSLKELNLSNTGITDNHLAPLSSLSQLDSLDLSNNRVSSAAVGTILYHTRLSHLRLSSTDVSDEGIERLFRYRPLVSLDISNTQVSEDTWKDFKGEIRTSINLVGTPGITKFLDSVPESSLPLQIVVHSNGFEIYGDDLLQMRHEKENVFSTTFAFCPETLKLWSPSELLSRKLSRRLNLGICDTGRTQEILKLATQQNVRSIEIVAEDLAQLDSIEIPRDVRYLNFKTCTLNTSILEALTKCPWLRQLSFHDCKLSDCSFEPLSRMPMLWGLILKNVVISEQQRKQLDALRPTLGEAKGW